MSNEIYDAHGLSVTRFCGPEGEGVDRRRWQFYTGSTPAVLTLPAVFNLVYNLISDGMAGPSGHRVAPLPAGTVSAFCLACDRRINLDADPFEVVGPGERGYTCPDCGERTVYYSAGWIDGRE